MKFLTEKSDNGEPMKRESKRNVSVDRVREENL